ncbi:MAG: GH25 family lysozyme [Anaerovoracaceae bacterium]
MMNAGFVRRFLTTGMMALVITLAAFAVVSAAAGAEAYGSTSTSRYTGKTYTHSDTFGDVLIVDGVDVSYVQKNNVDWQQAKADGIDVAIIRVGARGYGDAGRLIEDDYYKENFQKAKDAGLLVGAYFFSQALDELEAYAEANYTLKLLDGIQLDLPVYMDYEFAGGSSGRLTKANLSKAKMTANAVKFCETIEASGIYKAGFYANRNFLKNTVDGELISSRWPVWVAQYNTSTDYGNAYHMWQYTSGGTIGGYSGRVDMNFMYLPKSTAATSILSLAESTVSILGNSTFTYSDGVLHKPMIRVTQYGLSLIEGVDYKVHYLKNSQAGTGYVMVSGMGSYTDYKLIPFIIQPSSNLSGITVDRILNKYYTGSPRVPSSITVRDADGSVLVEGVDYTFTVRDATEVGTATVTITFMGNRTGTMTTTYKILPTGQTLTADKTVYEVSVGDAPFTLTGIQQTGNGKLSYISSNPEVATVSSSGKVTIVGAGTAVITVKAAATAEYKEATLDITVNVTQPPQMIYTKEDSYTLKRLSMSFFLGAETDTGTEVIYQTTDPSVARVREDGRVTLMGPGTAEIIITAPANGIYGAAEKRIPITVTDMEEEAYAQRFNTLKEGIENTRVVLLKAYPEKNKVKLTWKKSNSGYAVEAFQIWRSQKKSSGYSKIFTTATGSRKYYINSKDVKPGQTYWYKVRGVRSLEGKLVYTDFVKIQVTTPKE